MDVFTELYTQLDPDRPLEADENDLYVNWQQELGEVDLKQVITRSVARARHPAYRLLTGHAGVGKTTELKRVAQNLWIGHKGRRFFVSFLDAQSQMDLLDADPIDLVFNIAKALVDDLTEKAKIDLGREKLEAFIKDFAEAVNKDVELEKVAFKLPVGFEASFRVASELRQGSPSVRNRLRKLLAGRQNRLMDEINETIRGALAKMRKQGDFDDALVIVDGLEKMPRRQVTPEYSNHEVFYLHNAGSLKFISCHVLYTVPVDLAMSSFQTRLRDGYSSEILTLPSIPVRGVDGQPHEAGCRALREIIQSRLRKVPKAGGGSLTEEDLFEDAADLQRLIELSGGHVRNLLTLLLAALNRTDDLPVPSAIVEVAVKKMANDTATGLRPDDWAVLEKIHETKQEPTRDNCPEFAQDPECWYRQLRGLCAFAYEEQGRRWYDWNPLLGEIDRGD